MRIVTVTIFLSLCLLALGVSAGEFPDDAYFDAKSAVRSKLEGQTAIEISTGEWIGSETTLDDCQGKVVVLDFWATWCGPCVASIPKNIELVESYPDDIVFIGMHSETSGWDKAPAMVEDREINYPVALDSGDTAKAYGINSFPTYIIIDRTGMIRAAGVVPSAVKTIVEELIGESGRDGRKLKFVSFDRDWFYNGSQRMKSWQEQLGQPALPIRAKAWWKPGDAVDEQSETESETDDDSQRDDGPHREDDPTGLVRVVHFTRPGMAITRTQLKSLHETAEKYAQQGVDFAVVCDRESDWEQARAFASEIELGVPMALDADAEHQDDASGETDDGNSDPNASRPREAGRTAMGYHVRIAPVTVLIDREGRIRATGLKLEQLSDALDVLLAERAN